MTKLFNLTVLLLCSLGVFAQIEFGIQFSPTLSTTRINEKTEVVDFSNFRSGIRFNAGPVVDIFIKDNVAVSAGLFYAVKRAGLTSSDTLASTEDLDVVVNTQYLQLPVALKLYTQEIAAGTKLYFTLGGALDFKIARDNVEINGDEDIDSETFSRIFDAGIVLGVGFEKKIGSRNKVFGGLTYNRAFINNITDDFTAFINNDNVRINRDQFALVMGFKF